MTPRMRVTLCVTLLCLCATLAVAQEPTQPQPSTQDAKQAERAAKEKSKADEKAMKDAERKAKADAKVDQSQPVGEKVAMSSNVEQTLTRLDRDLMNAAIRNDTALFEQTTADDYVSINPVGVVGNKAQAITGAKDFKFESLNSDDVQVRVHGDTAVVTGRATVKGQVSDQNISGTYRYMRVFAKHQGQWRMVAFQITPVAQQQSMQLPAEKKP